MSSIVSVNAWASHAAGSSRIIPPHGDPGRPSGPGHASFFAAALKSVTEEAQVKPHLFSAVSL
jgi:hypothetical protein